MVRELDNFSLLLELPQELQSGSLCKLAAVPEMKILGSYGENGKMQGVALWGAAEKNAAVYSIEAIDEAEAVVQELLTEVQARARALGAERISWSTCWKQARPKDIPATRCYYVYRFSNRNAADMVMMWNFQAKVLPLLPLVQRRGYRTKPLSEATEAQRQEMKELYRRGRPESQYLDDILEGKSGKLPEELNYFTVLGETVVAFSLVTELNGRNCLLRYRMSHPDHPGAMLPGFYATLNGFINSAYDKLRINVREDNLDTLQMLKKYMKTSRPVMYVLQYEGEI